MNLELPPIPDNMRWKVKDKYNDEPYSSLDGLVVSLQKRVLGFIWITEQSGVVKKISYHDDGDYRLKTRAERVREAADSILESWESDEANRKEKESFIGVYKQDQV